VNAHSNEVDDLHISCDGKQVIDSLTLMPLYVHTCWVAGVFEYWCIWGYSC